MTTYTFLNWMCCGATTLFFMMIFWRYRFLILKPSVLVLIFFHFQIQWAATLQAATIELYLPRPYPFFFMVQVFPLVGLFFSFFFLHRQMRGIYKKLVNTSLWSLTLKTRNLWLLLGGVVVIVFLYLRVTPLSQTGIYAIVLDPLQATAARESSLKLLDSTLLKYSFALLKSVLAPILSVLAAIYCFQNLKAKQWNRSVVGLAVFLFVLLAVSLPGARTPAGMVILTVLLALFVIYDMPIRPLYFFISFFLIVGLPIVMTIFREGKDLSPEMFLEYLQGSVFNRIFVVPMETGLWHTHYAQLNGFVGFAGIPKLAEFFSIDPVNLSNIIYLKYSPYNQASGLSNTCFVFSYYACFGMISLVFSWLALWSLDLSLLVLGRLRDKTILLATLVTLGTSCYAFTVTVFTTALITNGFLLILICAVLLDWAAHYPFPRITFRWRREHS